MAVARVPGRADCGQLERQHARRVSAIDQSFHAPQPQLADQRFDRQHEAGLAGHVIQQREPGASGDRAEDRIEDLLRAGDRKRNRCHHDPGSGTPGDEFEHVAAGVVLVIRGEQFITRFEAQRPEYCVDRRRRVGDPGQVPRRCAEETAESGPGLVEQALEVPDEELHRLALHALSQLRLVFQYLDRTGAERAVIQKDD